MQVDESAAAREVTLRQRRTGLRVAIAAAIGLTMAVATDAVIPFMGPVFAVQFLLSGAGSLPLPKAIGLVGVMLVVGQVFIVLTGVFGDRPLQLLALLGLFYFACFFVQARGRGGPVIFFALVVAIMIPLLNLVHEQLDTSMLVILLQGSISGVLLSWLAHVILPDDDATGSGPAPAAAPVDRPVLRSLVKTLVLLGAMTFCLTNNAYATALVIPITVASLLLQFDPATSGRAAVGLVVVNLLGGVLGSLAFSFVDLRPSLLFLFLTILLVCLFLGGRAVTGTAASRMYAGALTTFLILLGTGISPLPTTTPETFSTRIGYVLQAVAYTLCLMLAFWPGSPSANGSARSILGRISRSIGAARRRWGLRSAARPADGAA